MGKRSNVSLQWRGASESEERFRIGLGEGTSADWGQGVFEKGVVQNVIGGGLQDWGGT